MESGAGNDCVTIGPGKKWGVFERWCVYVVANPRAQKRHRGCSVIIESLAGVQRRYEYDCNVFPPMMEHLSRTQMSTCLSWPIERAPRLKFKRFSPGDHTWS